MRQRLDEGCSEMLNHHWVIYKEKTQNEQRGVLNGGHVRALHVKQDSHLEMCSEKILEGAEVRRIA